MAKLHALVDAPSVVIIAAATAAHLVLRLDQLFAADIPAPGNFNVCRFLRRLVILILIFDTHEWGMSRRFHSGSLTLRQKQRYCMARSVVGEGFRQPGQTQLLSPETQRRCLLDLLGTRVRR